MRKSIMSIQELEAQLLTLDKAERLRLSQLLTQSLLTTTPQISPPKPTLADVITQFRHNMSPEELDPNAEDVWQDVRDRTPVASEPRW
jgi:hypothetical protein